MDLTPFCEISGGVGSWPQILPVEDNCRLDQEGFQLVL